MFNVKYKFAHLQLFDVKFLFFEKHIFRKQKRTAVYGHASVVLDVKLTQGNDDPRKWSWDTNKFFMVTHSVHEYTKMRIPCKRYLTSTARTF